MTAAHLTKRQRALLEILFGDNGTVVLRSTTGSDVSTLGHEAASEAASRGMSVTVVADFLGTYSSYERAFQQRETQMGISFTAVQSAADLRLLMDEAEVESMSQFPFRGTVLIAGDALDRSFVARELASLRSQLLVVDGAPRNSHRSDVINGLFTRARRRLVLLDRRAPVFAAAADAPLIEWDDRHKVDMPIIEFALGPVELDLVATIVLLLHKYDLIEDPSDPTLPSLYEGLVLLQEDTEYSVAPFSTAEAQTVDATTRTEAEHLEQELESLTMDPRLVALGRALKAAPRPLAVISRAPWDADFLVAVLEELLPRERVWRASVRRGGPPPFDVVVCCDLDIEDGYVRRGPHSIWWDRPQDTRRTWYSGAGCIGRLELASDQQSFLRAALNAAG